MLKVKKIERIMKGVANHRRIQILELLGEEPELSVLDISIRLKINFKTASEHIRRLYIAGLVYKRSRTTHVFHTLSPLGFTLLKFLRKLEKQFE